MLLRIFLGGSCAQIRNRKCASFRLGGLTAALTTTKQTSVARATSTSDNRQRYHLEQRREICFRFNREYIKSLEFRY